MKMFYNNIMVGPDIVRPAIQRRQQPSEAGVRVCVADLVPGRRGDLRIVAGQHDGPLWGLCDRSHGLDIISVVSLRRGLVWRGRGIVRAACT